MSPEAERELWFHLRGKNLNGYQFRRQHPIGPYFADFACVKQRLVVEVDGSSHSKLNAEEKDAMRTEFMNNAGWKVVRFSNIEVYTDIGNVLNNIAQHIDDETDNADEVTANV